MRRVYTGKPNAFARKKERKKEREKKKEKKRFGDKDFASRML